MRKNENINKQLSTATKTQLNLEEKKLVLKLIMCLKHLNCQRAINMVAYAWGVTRYTVQRLIKKETLGGGNLIQEIRKAKGLTVFHSESRQQSTFTTYSVFKKVKRMENRSEKLTNNQIFSAWMCLSDAEMHRYEELTMQQKERCALLLVEIGEILKRTQGGLTWQQLASSLCGAGVPIVSHMSIARTIMNLPDSTYKVSMERVGKLIPAKRDSYRRVYKDDNTFSYPHIPENMIRKKGEFSFQSMDVNATKEGTVSAPKYLLLKKS